MKTDIFKDFKAFTKRKDRFINGVSPEFAKSNPDYKGQNNTNIGCWNCKSSKNCIDSRDCIECEKVILCCYCKSSKNLSQSENCEDCIDGVFLYDCVFCEKSVSLKGCFKCVGCKGLSGLLYETNNYYIAPQKHEYKNLFSPLLHYSKC